MLVSAILTTKTKPPSKRMKFNTSDDRKLAPDDRQNNAGFSTAFGAKSNGASLYETGAPLMPSNPNFVCRANEVIFFKFIGCPEDMDDPLISFKPVFTHQLFHTEKIRGYKNLRINLYFAEGSLVTFLQVSYDEKLSDLVYVDDVVECLAKFMQNGYITDKDEFLSIVERDRKLFYPPGEAIYAYERVDADSVPTNCKFIHKDRYSADHNVSYVITLSKFDTPGFKAYHERLQFFLLFFIDASSYIDSSDLIWNITCIFEKRKRKNGGEPHYCFIGYCTLYSFLVFPCGRRLRISQILVLPPFQRHGHGGQLLQCIYNHAQDKDYVEVNVEDPSDGFQFLRDKTDTANALKYGLFQRNSKSGDSSLPEHLRELTPAYMKRVKQKLRITDIQIRRCYETFKLDAINPDDEDMYREYRLEIKRRLNKVFAEDLSIYVHDIEGRKKRLAELYLELENKYRLILVKLKEPKKDIFRKIDLPDVKVEHGAMKIE